MKYRELLELYKKKELGEEQREMVERDIERHEAISEYLFEMEEADILQGSAEMAEGYDPYTELYGFSRQTLKTGFSVQTGFSRRKGRGWRISDRRSD